MTPEQQAEKSQIGWLERATLLYERAVFGGDSIALDEAEQELDAVQAGLALARGRIMHARFLADPKEDPRELTLFEQACELYRKLGDSRGEGESLFWVGTFHQVVRDDNDAALPALDRSYELASAAGDCLPSPNLQRKLATAKGR